MGKQWIDTNWGFALIFIHPHCLGGEGSSDLLVHVPNRAAFEGATGVCQFFHCHSKSDLLQDCQIHVQGFTISKGTAYEL